MTLWSGRDQRVRLTAEVKDATETTLQDDNHLPDRLSIDLVRRFEDDPWIGPVFEASSPQFPGLTAESTDCEDAVTDLLWSILNVQDLPTELVEALRNAGHSEAVVEAWSGLAQGRPNCRYRYDVDAAVRVLKEFTDGGVPALTACQYLDLGIIDPALAIDAYANGGTLDDAVSYIDHSETHKWWKWDYDIDPWIRSGFPFARGKLYAYDCSVDVAYEWEEVVAEYDISDLDLATMLRAKFTPRTVRAHLETEGNNPATLLADARRVAGQRPREAWGDPARHEAHDPWAAPASSTGVNPWGDGYDDEPPF